MLRRLKFIVEAEQLADPGVRIVEKLDEYADRELSLLGKQRRKQIRRNTGVRK